MPQLISTYWAIAALTIFIFKQLFADFLLQTSWMALGKERDEGWLWPLTAHVAIHAAATLLIFLALVPTLWWIALVDFAVHFVIDRAKGRLNRVFDTDTTKTGFWWLLGIDQTLHQLTHLGFAMAIVIAKSA